MTMRPYSITLTTAARTDVITPERAQVGDLVVATCAINVRGRNFRPGDALKIAGGTRENPILADADGTEAYVPADLIPLSVVILPGRYLPEQDVMVSLATVERVARRYIAGLSFEAGHVDRIVSLIRDEVR